MTASRRFDRAAVHGLAEPVRRYFAHALADGAPLGRGARLDVRGRIRVGAWLRFDSVWEGDGRSFSWRATSGPGPFALLPERGVAWRAVSDEHIVATWTVPPETPEVHIIIDADGAVRSYRAERWHDAKAGYLPFGVDVHAERTFGGVTIPSRLTAGWEYGTDRWSPFFDAEVTGFAFAG